jgi:integrase
MTPDKKDIQGQEQKCDDMLTKLPDDKTLTKRNKELIQAYAKDVILGKAGKKPIGKKRLYRSIGILKLMANDWFKKDLDKVTDSDMEQFVLDMKSGKITQSSRFKKRKGKAYGTETQPYYLKFVQKYYRYLGKPELVNWINTSFKHKQTEALAKDEINRLLDATGNLRDKIIIQLLFDSGARIEEFLNVKYKDVVRKGDYYTLNFRISKTRPRVVSVPMKESTDLINRWLIENKDKSPDSFLIDLEYHALGMMLKRLGEKTLNKNVHPHLFRHSSMTYYANLLKHYPFAKRYGLALNSDVVSRYIDLSGIDEEETHNIVKASRELDMERQIKELQEQNLILKEQMNSIFNTEQFQKLAEEVLRQAKERKQERRTKNDEKKAA